jgi:predicted flap endonuclease-1-like 5' DNA nuclease
MSPFLTGLVLIVVGVVGVIWGYRIFRILLPIYGAVAGYIIAYNWLGQTSWVLALIVGIVLAIILALIAFFLWSALFAVAGALLGIGLAGVIATSLTLSTWFAVLIAVVLAVVVGWLFWKFRNEMIIIGTVLLGAGLAAEGLGTWFGLRTGIGARLANPWWLLLLVAVVWIVLIIVGIMYQWPRYRHLSMWGFGGAAARPGEQAAAQPAPTRAAPAVETAAPAAVEHPAAAVGAAAVAAGAVAAHEEAPAEAAAPAAEVEHPAAAVGAAAMAAGAVAAEEEAPAEAAAPAAEVGAPAAAAATRRQDLEATLGAADLGNLREDVEFIEGVGPVYGAKLKEAGVASVMDLLMRGATRKGRADLVQATGIRADLILTWVNHADLFRITGVGKQFGELLEAAGVDTVVELAQRNPQNLFNRLAQVNTEKKLAGRAPRQDEVSKWIEQAKGLQRVVEY